MSTTPNDMNNGEGRSLASGAAGVTRPEMERWAHALRARGWTVMPPPSYAKPSTAEYLRRMAKAGGWLEVKHVDSLHSARCSTFLRKAARNGEVERKPHPRRPDRYVYRITEAGRRRIQAV